MGATALTSVRAVTTFHTGFLASAASHSVVGVSADADIPVAGIPLLLMSLIVLGSLNAKVPALAGDTAFARVSSVAQVRAVARVRAVAGVPAVSGAPAIFSFSATVGITILVSIPLVT